MNEDKIIEKLIDHEEQLSEIKQKIATKDDIHEVMQTQDEMMTILKRLDEDRIFTHKWVDRIESDLEQTKSRVAQSEEELSKLKADLKIA
jgi:uncharacterized protein YjgD (DUF1641 family)